MVDRSSLDRAHAAFLALPEAKGAVAGAMIVLPRDTRPEDDRAILLAAARRERSSARLVLGRLGAMRLDGAEHVTDAGGALDPASWAGPARRWAPVTPVDLQ
jgi:hypothetical protein